MKKHEFISWKNDPTTKAILAILKDRMELVKEHIYAQIDDFNNDFNDVKLRQLNRDKGYIAALNDVVNMSVEDDNEEDEESNSSGA